MKTVVGWFFLRFVHRLCRRCACLLLLLPAIFFPHLLSTDDSFCNSVNSFTQIFLIPLEISFARRFFFYVRDNFSLEIRWKFFFQLSSPVTFMPLCWSSVYFFSTVFTAFPLVYSSLPYTQPFTSLGSTFPLRTTRTRVLGTKKKKKKNGRKSLALP